MADKNHNKNNQKIRKVHIFNFSDEGILAGWKWIMILLTVISGALAYWFDYQLGQATEARLTKEKEAAESQNEHLKEVADEAIQRAKELEDRQKPRTITSEQRSQFINFLAATPKGVVGVHIFNQDAEITQYANQIKDMLTAAGYDTQKMVGISFGSSATPVGIFILIKDKDNPPIFAGPIQRAFSNIGIDAQGMIDSTITNANVDMMVIVGTKK